MAHGLASHGVVLAIALSLAGAGCVNRSSDRAAKERLKAYILDAPPEKLSTRLGTDFDGKVELVGASVEPSGSVKPGQEVTVTLYWKSKQKLDSGWQLFTHVLDAAGERTLNLDNVGALREAKNGKQALPPSSWDPGKVYADRQTFRVPAGFKGNRLTVSTGIWRGNERLSIKSGKSDSQNRAIVTTLTVSGAGRPKKDARIPEVRVDKLAPGLEITIDGKLDEEAWKKAPLLGPFVDVRTGEPNQTFPVNGSVRLAYDETHLYVGFEVLDADVVGGFPKDAKDPHLWTRDTVEIMVDPDGDGDNEDYYEIQVNPQNLVFDSRFDRYNEPKTEPDGPFGHEDWSSNLKSAVKIEGTIDDPKDRDKGYTVEIAIPWASFTKAKKSPPALGDTWRMNFYAMQNNGGVAWSPILGRGNFHRASRFGRVIWAEAGFVLPEEKRANAPAAPSASALPSAAPAVSPEARRIPARELLERGRAERERLVVPERQRNAEEAP
jgi:hypothetical protein